MRQNNAGAKSVEIHSAKFPGSEQIYDRVLTRRTPVALRVINYDCAVTSE